MFATGSSKEKHKNIVSLAFVLCGAALIAGASIPIHLGDLRIARRHAEEADAWIARQTPQPNDARAIVPSTHTIISPGADGYLLIVPKIGLRAVVRQLELDVLTGRNTPALRRYGLGQVPYTTYLGNGSPGADGTAVIAGHRTTSGAPLRDIDRLSPGDIILIRKAGIEQRWLVETSTIVPPTAIETIRSRSGTRRLALLACNPPFSAKERLIVMAGLQTETVPVGAAPRQGEVLAVKSSRQLLQR